MRFDTSTAMIDLGTDGNTIDIPCAGFTKAAIQLDPDEGSLSTGVLTLGRSISGNSFVALPTATTYSATGIQDTVDCTDIAFLRLRVTTVDAGVRLRVRVLLVDDPTDTDDTGGGGGIGTYDNWIPIVAEESGNLSTSTGSGYQFSMGNGDIGTNFGAVIPYDYEVMAVGISTRGATTSTVEVYVGTANTTTMTASGVSVSLSSSRSAYTVAGTPYAANAGDWVTFRTTSGSGGGGVRVTAWIKPR